MEEGLNGGEGVRIITENPLIFVSLKIFHDE
jgi:hypothetical protein